MSSKSVMANNEFATDIEAENTVEMIAQIPCANILGEGVQWNHREQAVWWTDIKSSKIFRYHLASKQLKTWDGFAWFDKDTGAVEWIAQPEANLVGNRLNDGRVDRQGRFWAGSIVEQKNASDQSAGLFSLNAQGETQQHLSRLTISNSLCWSLDSSKLYHADSPSHQIKVYDFDAQTGTLGEGKVFVQTNANVEPDGSCIDAEGHLWNAEWGGSRLVRYNAEGVQVSEFKTLVTQPTCMAFGGDDMNLLFVTSARIGLSEEALAAQPEAGNLFIYRTNFRGVNECWYKGVASK
jgi:sugar lactone lactonase YvrE